MQTFYESSSHRNELRDGPLKAVPDLDAVITKSDHYNILHRSNLYVNVFFFL